MAKRLRVFGKVEMEIIRLLRTDRVREHTLPGKIKIIKTRILPIQ